MKKKIYFLFLSFLPVMASFAIQIVIALFVIFGFSIIGTIRLILEGVTDPNQLISGMFTLLTDSLFNDVLMIVTFIALAGVFLLWHCKQKDKPVVAPPDKVFCFSNIAIILISGLAMQIAVSMCLNLILPLFPQTLENYSSLLENLVGGNVIISVISTAVLAPIVEELIFRELMSKQLRKLFPFWFANMIQALAFGIYHLNIVQGIYAFFIGLLFGYVAYRLKSIWASIMLHGIVNASGLVLGIILPDALFESTMGMFIFAVLCGTITILLTLLYRIPEREEQPDHPFSFAGAPEFPADIDASSMIEPVREDILINNNNETKI